MDLQKIYEIRKCWNAREAMLTILPFIIVIHGLIEFNTANLYFFRWRVCDASNFLGLFLLVALGFHSIRMVGEITLMCFFYTENVFSGFSLSLSCLFTSQHIFFIFLLLSRGTFPNKMSGCAVCSMLMLTWAHVSHTQRNFIHSNKGVWLVTLLDTFCKLYIHTYLKEKCLMSILGSVASNYMAMAALCYLLLIWQTIHHLVQKCHMF